MWYSPRYEIGASVSRKLNCCSFIVCEIHTHHAMRPGVISVIQAKLALLNESAWVMSMESVDICSKKKKWCSPHHKIRCTCAGGGGGTYNLNPAWTWWVWKSQWFEGWSMLRIQWAVYWCSFCEGGLSQHESRKMKGSCKVPCVHAFVLYGASIVGMDGMWRERDRKKKSGLPQTFKCGWGKSEKGSKLSYFSGKGQSQNSGRLGKSCGPIVHHWISVSWSLTVTVRLKLSCDPAPGDLVGPG